MGYTAAEFAAVLPAAMRDWRVSGGPRDWRVAAGDGREVAAIRVDAQPERRVGALSLPVLSVTIDLSKVSAELAREFLRRFERGFHRGGG